MSTDKNHSESLKRYLAGEMSAEEAHAFERAALDDPFLSEALEGFEGHAPEQIKEDLTELRKKLKAEKSQYSRGFMKIAAAVTLLMIAGLSVWLIISDNRQVPKELAIQENEQDEATAETLKSPAGESPDNQSKEELSQEGAVQQKTNEPAEPKDIPYETVKKRDSNRTGKASPSEVQRLKKEEATKQVTMQLPSAAAKPPKIQIVEIADEEEIEVDLDITVTEETVVESIIFEEAPEEEIVAVESFAASSLKANDSAPTIRLRGVSSFNSSPAPITGWEAYNQYLSDSLRYPEAAKRMGIEGRVYVQATLAKTGAVDTAFVLKGIGSGCDEEALRLVMNSPPFLTYGTDTKVIIPVKFEIK